MSLLKSLTITLIAFTLTRLKVRAFPLLLNHVVKVVFLCTEKQMQRSYALTVIALMQHASAFRDWAKCQDVRQLVCGHGFRSYACPNVSVTFASNCTRPLPAIVLWPLAPVNVNFRPESLSDRNVRERSTTSTYRVSRVERSSAFCFAALRTRLELFYDLVSHAVHSLIVNKLVRLEQRLRVVSSRFILADPIVTTEV